MCSPGFVLDDLLDGRSRKRSPAASGVGSHARELPLAYPLVVLNAATFPCSFLPFRTALGSARSMKMGRSGRVVGGKQAKSRLPFLSKRGTPNPCVIALLFFFARFLRSSLLLCSQLI